MIRSDAFLCLTPATQTFTLAIPLHRGIVGRIAKLHHHAKLTFTLSSHTTPQMSNCKATLLTSNTSHAYLCSSHTTPLFYSPHPSPFCTYMHAMHPISLQYFETWSLVDTTPSIHICKIKKCKKNSCLLRGLLFGRWLWSLH